MKPYHWALLGALLLAGSVALGYQIKSWQDEGDRLDMEQAVARQSATFDALLEAGRIEDSLRHDRQERVLREQERETAAAADHAGVLSGILDTLRRRARTASDSAGMVPVLENIIAAKDDQIRALTGTTTTLASQVRAEIRATGRLRAELVAWKRGVDTVWTPTITPTENRPGRTLETLAIGLATASACRRVSLGCVAGLVVTGLRVR